MITKNADRAHGVLRRFAGTASVTTIILLSMPAAAQLASSSSIPQGSPVDTETARQSGQQNGQNSNNTSGQTLSTPYEPVSVNGEASTVRDGAEGMTAGPRRAQNGALAIDSVDVKKPAAPGEFEKWAREVTGRPLKRYGADLLVTGARDFAVPSTTTVPPDYALNVGDTVSIGLTGSVDGSVDAEIDRDGRIFLPNIGSVSLVGVHYRDLKDRIAAAVGRQFRGFEVAVSIKKLRGVRIYVTGFANNPGAYSVTSLSTLANAVLAAGGPTAGGSFRSIKLYRNGAEVADFDLYQLLRKGNRSFDPLLQNEDVLFIPPVGKQVAVIGSVNEEAIYETRAGESLAEVLALAGGPTDVADASRLIVYSLSDQDTVGSRQIDRMAASTQLAEGGDIVQLLPQGTLTRPLDRQQAVVRIEGEVNRPGNYYVPPNTPLAQIIEMAGGLTPRAFVYGTRFYRESVRAQQRRGFLEAVDQMDSTLAAAPLNGDGLGDAGERQTQITAARAFIEKLRTKEPDGRLVIDMTSDQATLPLNLPVENNDRILVPPRVETVGVFGAVYRPASFLLHDGKEQRVKDYVVEAGGTVRAADKGNIFVVRANGSVLTRSRGALNARVLPGDTIFVPIKTQSSSIWAKIRDISAIAFQFGISAAAIAAIN